jgi:hypothetical protein
MYKYTLLFLLFIFTTKSFSQPPIGNYPKINVPTPKCQYCNYALPQDKVSTSNPNYASIYHAPTCPYNPKSKTSPGVKSMPSTNDQIKVMVTGMIMQTLITNLFSPPVTTQKTQAQIQAEQQAQFDAMMEQTRQQKIRDSIALAKHNKLISEFKVMDKHADLDFKSIDGEMEILRADASSQFDKLGNLDFSKSVNANEIDYYNNIPDSVINTVFEPDNDPMIVDLREAKLGLVDTNLLKNAKNEALKKEDPKLKNDKKFDEEQCKSLEMKIARDIENRNKYEKTIDLTLSELDKWKEQNTGAMIDAYLEGLNFITDKFIKWSDKKREPAELTKKTMLEILKKDPSNISAKKVIEFIDVQYLNKNWSEIIIRTYNETKDFEKYYNVMKDALQNFTNGFAQVDKDLITMLNVPELQKHLNDQSFTDAVKFSATSLFEMAGDSEKVQNAFQSIFKLKIPYFSVAQFAVNQAYNITNWYTSRNMILELNHVHGKELQTVQYLNDRLFSDRLLLKQNCNQ